MLPFFLSLNQKEVFNNYYGFWQRLTNDEEKPHLFQPYVLDKIKVEEPREIFERDLLLMKNYNTAQQRSKYRIVCTLK